MWFFAAEDRSAVDLWEETVNTIAVRRFALFYVAALSLVVISAHLASASSSLDGDKYVHPNLAADGVTSDDVALAKAAAACDAAGTRLVLPAGKILLTGAATVVLNHCAMMGVGAPAGDNTGDYGTTILLTSESVPPFSARNRLADFRHQLLLAQSDDRQDAVSAIVQRRRQRKGL
jgi:hypothetical protein